LRRQGDATGLCRLRARRRGPNPLIFNEILSAGGTRIRTWTGGVRIDCSTVGLGDTTVIWKPSRAAKPRALVAPLYQRFRDMKADRVHRRGGNLARVESESSVSSLPRPAHSVCRSRKMPGRQVGRGKRQPACPTLARMPLRITGAKHHRTVFDPRTRKSGSGRSARGPQKLALYRQPSSVVTNLLKRLARPRGVEPLTPRSVVWCSIQLSYGRPPASHSLAGGHNYSTAMQQGKADRPTPRWPAAFDQTT
jgi:hypothetical protein